MLNLALKSATLICPKIGMQDLLMHTIASLMIRFGVYGLPRELGDQNSVKQTRMSWICSKMNVLSPCQDGNKVWI